MDDLVVKLIFVAIVFFSGLIFREPIREKYNDLKKFYKVRYTKKTKVKIFLISCGICTKELTQLLLDQNNNQDMFQFELVDWDLWKDNKVSTEILENLHMDSKLEFCNAFQREIKKYYSSKNLMDEKIVSIVITDLPFPQNFYTWNTKDKKTIVIGIKSLSSLFQKEVFEKIVLRIVQRMIVYSMDIKGLAVHESSIKCLFDFTIKFDNLENLVNDVSICEQCEKAIINSSINNFKFLNEWLDNTK